MKTGDRFQADDIGKFIAVLRMKDGQEFHVSAASVDEADQICKDAMEEGQCRKAFSATRSA